MQSSIAAIASLYIYALDDRCYDERASLVSAGQPLLQISLDELNDSGSRILLLGVRHCAGGISNGHSSL